MPGIIQLLPDSIANQIAAGEVIQRPGSAVKELLENAIDSGATKIKLVVKDAGRTLIQVTDNGCGMNETDARLCFERHATSKIKKADDLFNLHTKGFRGEALASIAAIAQVELKTKRAEDDLGTAIQVEGSEILKQEPVSTANGTVFSMKNLFYNVPARRNFLKTDQVELRHIIEEFQRVVLVHPDIEFTFTHNGDELFHLNISNLRQRLVNFFGKSLNEKLVPVETDTVQVNIHGYVFKPESCKKVRGDQFFFVNNRFIKSPALHHAIQTAYANILPNDHHAGYFIFLEVPPGTLDVNIHPTKTEVKFEHEKDIYTILNAAVRQA
ncbi:MAG TPA: DNA mismatch repair endonuclease MutL, partial [Flavobacteriales bacterium]|nr:DNA mismatch repair endonuclease MutL [Flavobacteriales bacterium]